MATVDYSKRLERATQQVKERCLAAFDRLNASKALTLRRLTVELAGCRLATSEVRATQVGLEWPEPLSYDSSGRLTASIRGHRVSVAHDGKRRFRAEIDGKQRHPCPRHVVEEELGLQVHEKRSGGNSESVPRAIWRHLVDRFNLFDEGVHYDRYG